MRFPHLLWIWSHCGRGSKPQHPPIRLLNLWLGPANGDSGRYMVQFLSIRYSYIVLQHNNCWYVGVTALYSGSNLLLNYSGLICMHGPYNARRLLNVSDDCDYDQSFLFILNFKISKNRIIIIIGCSITSWGGISYVLVLRSTRA